MTTAMNATASMPDKAKLLATLPEEWRVSQVASIREHPQSSGRKLFVLDDDPTGTQTVHGVPVRTDWSVDVLVEELMSDEPVCFLLTNSRSLPRREANRLYGQIGLNLMEASRLADRRFAVITRCDSTLRGHFPSEVDALQRGLGAQADVILFAPAFMEGGRLTIKDKHYLAQGDRLIPVAATEFARDPSFGYTNSLLPNWMEEVSGGAIVATEVASLSLPLIRQGGPVAVREYLTALPSGTNCVVNAVSYRDLEVVAMGALDAEAEGTSVLIRSAASMVRVLAGIEQQPLLSAQSLGLANKGNGVIIVGSHVPLTTRQVDALLRLEGIAAFELGAAELLEDQFRERLLRETADRVNSALEDGLDVTIYTSRALLDAGDGAKNLSIGQRISSGLVDVMSRIEATPRYIVAKGGITSSDIATEALNVKRAEVLGQIQPGVSVWRLGEESRFPGTPYVVFPGNVGQDDSLAALVADLRLGALGCADP